MSQHNSAHAIPQNEQVPHTGLDGAPGMLRRSRAAALETVPKAPPNARANAYTELKNPTVAPVTTIHALRGKEDLLELAQTPLRTLPGGVKVLKEQSGSGNRVVVGTHVVVYFKGFYRDDRGVYRVFTASPQGLPYVLQVEQGGGGLGHQWEIGLLGMQGGAKRTLELPIKMAMEDFPSSDLVKTTFKSKEDVKVFLEIEILQVNH